MTVKELCQMEIPGLNEETAERFQTYCDMLLDWNTRVNLTAITDPLEVVRKHFADSLLPAALIPANARVIDVGTGAGFPGLPLKLLRPDIELTLLDALNKRIRFLQEVCTVLAIPAQCIHVRAEDGARRIDLRERFDVALSRAVAGAAALAELTTPYLKVGGQSLMYKGPQGEEELAAAKNALKLLRCRGEMRAYPASWGERNVIVLTKLERTPEKYPRKAGTVEKNPL